MAKDEPKKEAPPATETKSSGGGGKVPAILAIINLLLTIGIGAVVFIQFKKDKNHEQVTDIDPNAPTAAPAAGGEGGHGGEKKEEGHGAPAKSGPKVVSLDQFTVNLSTAVGAPPKFARVVIAIEVGSDETSQELTQKMPQVRNSIIDLFNSKRPTDLQTGEGRNFLKEEIRNALNSFLVTGKIKGIFFSNFSVSN